MARIGLVIYGELDDRSGGFLYDSHLVAALRRRGHEVVIFAQDEAGAFAGRWMGPGRRLRTRDEDRRLVERVGAAGHLDALLVDELNWRSVRRTLLSVRRARLVTRMDDADRAAGVGVARASRAAGPPRIIAIVHHLSADEPGFHPLRWRGERRVLRLCDAWIANSPPTLDRVRRCAGVPRPSAVATPAADRFVPAPTEAPAATATTSRGAAPAPLRLVSVGNVIRRKNIHRVLAAIAPLPNVELDIYGSVAYEREYAELIRRRAAHRDLAGRVRIYGRVSDARIRDALVAADVLIAPSTYEGFGIVYLEAMTAGCVVIASRRGGARTMVEHGTSGLLVNPHSTRSIRRAVEAATDGELRSRLIAGGYTAARRFAGWERSMDGATRFIEALL